MTGEEIISIAALCTAIMIFIAIQLVVLSFEISNLKDKINDLEFKIDHKLVNQTRSGGG